MSATTAEFVVADLGMGGAERHAVTVCGGVARERLAMGLYCLHAGGPLAGRAQALGVRVTEGGAGDGPVGRVVAAIRLWRHLRRTRPDLVVTAGFQAGIIGRVVARAAGVPATVCWKHNIGHLGAVGWKERLSERFMAPFTTRYVGVCHTQVRYLVDELGVDPRRLGVAHNSVPGGPEPDPVAALAQRGALGLSDGEFVVAVAAVLRPEKDHATLVRAVAELASRNVPVTLLVIGDGPERPFIEALVDELGLAGRVRMLGQRDDVDALLGACDAVALASVTIECFPYAILEAMAAAKPVVATAIGGLPEMVEDGETALLVPPRAHLAMADAIAALAADPTRAAAMGRAGRRRLEQRWSFTAAMAAVERELTAAVGAGSKVVA